MADQVNRESDVDSLANKPRCTQSTLMPASMSTPVQGTATGPGFDIVNNHVDNGTGSYCNAIQPRATCDNITNRSATAQKVGTSYMDDLTIIDPSTGVDNRVKPGCDNPADGTAIQTTSAQSSITYSQAFEDDIVARGELIIKSASNEELFDENDDDIIIHDEVDLNQTVMPNPNRITYVRRQPQSEPNNTENNTQHSAHNPMPGFTEHVVRGVSKSVAKTQQVGMVNYQRPNALVRVTRGPTRQGTPIPSEPDNAENNTQHFVHNPMPGFTEHVVRGASKSIAKSQQAGMANYQRPNALIRVTRGPTRQDTPIPSTRTREVQSRVEESRKTNSTAPNGLDVNGFTKAIASRMKNTIKTVPENLEQSRRNCSDNIQTSNRLRSDSEVTVVSNISCDTRDLLNGSNSNSICNSEAAAQNNISRTTVKASSEFTDLNANSMRGGEYSTVEEARTYAESQDMFQRLSVPHDNGNQGHIESNSNKPLKHSAINRVLNTQHSGCAENRLTTPPSSQTKCADRPGTPMPSPWTTEERQWYCNSQTSPPEKLSRQETPVGSDSARQTLVSKPPNRSIFQEFQKTTENHSTPYRRPGNESSAQGNSGFTPANEENQLMILNQLDNLAIQFQELGSFTNDKFEISESNNQQTVDVLNYIERNTNATANKLIDIEKLSKDNAIHLFKTSSIAHSKLIDIEKSVKENTGKINEIDRKSQIMDDLQKYTVRNLKDNKKILSENQITLDDHNPRDCPCHKRDRDLNRKFDEFTRWVRKNINRAKKDSDSDSDETIQEARGLQHSPSTKNDTLTRPAQSTRKQHNLRKQGNIELENTQCHPTPSEKMSNNVGNNQHFNLTSDIPQQFIGDTLQVETKDFQEIQQPKQLYTSGVLKADENFRGHHQNQGHQVGNNQNLNNFQNINNGNSNNFNRHNGNVQSNSHPFDSQAGNNFPSRQNANQDMNGHGNQNNNNGYNGPNQNNNWNNQGNNNHVGQNNDYGNSQYHQNFHNRNQNNPLNSNIEAEKTSKRLCATPNSIPKFEPETTTMTVGYFILDKIKSFCESNRLNLISLVHHWLHHAFPSMPSSQFKGSHRLACEDLRDIDLEKYLLRLARIIHGEKRPLTDMAKARIQLESVTSFAARLMVEYKVVTERDLEDPCKEQDIVTKVFNHICQLSENDIGTTMSMLKKQIFRKNHIKNERELLEVSREVDEILRQKSDAKNPGNPYTRVIAAGSRMEPEPILKTRSKSPIVDDTVSFVDTAPKKPRAKKVECKKCKFTFEQKRPEDFVCYSCVPAPPPAALCGKCNAAFQPEKDYFTTCRPCYEEIIKERKSRSTERKTDQYRSQSRDRNAKSAPYDRNRSYDRSRDRRAPYQRNDRSYDRRDNRQDFGRDYKDRRENNLEKESYSNNQYSDRRGRDNSRRNDPYRGDGQRRQRSDSWKSSGSWPSYHRPREESQDNRSKDVHTKEQKQPENRAPSQSPNRQNSTRFEKDVGKQVMAVVSSGHFNGNEHILYTDTLTNGNIKEMVEPYQLNKEHSRLIALAVEIDSSHKGKALFDSGANLNTVTKEYIQACEAAGREKFKIIENRKKVRDFEGKECMTLGTVTMGITLGEALYEGEFTVINGSYGCEIILGTPFLACFDILSNMREQIINVMRSKNQQ